MPIKFGKICALFLAAVLSSCAAENGGSAENDGIPKEDVSVAAEQPDIEITETEESYFNDFAIYNNQGKFVISLLSRPDDIDYEDEDVARVLSGFDIIDYDESNPNDVYVRRLFFSRGCNEVVQTGKMISTAGNSGGKYLVSDEAAVLEVYGIDPKTEEYCSDENDVIKTVTVYYNINDDGTAEVRHYPKGTDISSLDALEDANSYISFSISKVKGIVMSIAMEYKRK